MYRYLVWQFLCIYFLLREINLVASKPRASKSQKKPRTKKFAFSSSVHVPQLTRKRLGFASKILRQSFYEQEIEDINAVCRMNNHLERRLIVMPLSEAFKANTVDAMFNKVHYGDKCSLPGSLGRYIYDNRLEVPWIFEIKPVSSSSSDAALSPKRSRIKSTAEGCEDLLSKFPTVLNPINAPYFSKGKVRKAYISPMDFRSPENYIFLPKWLMNDLNIETNDLVDISLVRIKLADLVVLQPVTKDWDSVVIAGNEEREEKKGSKQSTTVTANDAKSLLEREINKYSSLTAGTTVYIKINNVELPIYVKETYAEGGISVHGVRVQDSDIKTDIDRSIVDSLAQYEKETGVVEVDKEL
jgi:ubiquitin fusion degradation protein 1